MKRVQEEQAKKSQADGELSEKDLDGAVGGAVDSFRPNPGGLAGAVDSFQPKPGEDGALIGLLRPGEKTGK